MTDLAGADLVEAFCKGMVPFVIFGKGLARERLRHFQGRKVHRFCALELCCRLGRFTWGLGFIIVQRGIAATSISGVGAASPGAWHHYLLVRESGFIDFGCLSGCIWGVASLFSGVGAA